MYSIFSFFFVFLFNKHFIYKSIFCLNKACFIKLTWCTFTKKTISIFTSNPPQYKTYLLFFFNTAFKFYYSNLESYYNNPAVFFILPKRQLRSILLRKQFFFFLISITQKKVKSFFLKKLFTNNSSLYNDYELFSNLNFFFYKNQKLLFKKISTVFFKSNKYFLEDEFNLFNSLLLQVNRSPVKFLIFKKLISRNKYITKKAFNLKKAMNTKPRLKYL